MHEQSGGRRALLMPQRPSFDTLHTQRVMVEKTRRGCHDRCQEYLIGTLECSKVAHLQLRRVIEMTYLRSPIL